MEMQTMASEGGGEGQQQAQFLQALATQSSLYGLTLNEVQSQLGEPLRSMNLNELLESIRPAEGDRPMAATDLESPSTLPGSGSGLHRRGSLTVAAALGKNQVGREPQRRTGRERELALGDMTLENFLAMAGVAAEGPDGERSGDVGAAAQPYAGGPHWPRQYLQVPSLQHQARQNVATTYGSRRPVVEPPAGVGLGGVLEAGHSDPQLTVPSSMLGALSDTQTPRRKRVASGDVAEKTADRRQKRMIKNRESAARSRARKQAYTNELENKISRLEEEIARLKKQQQMEKILHTIPSPEPKFRLRRTSSASF